MLLSPLQTRALFEDAAQNHYAILAVNADSPACVRDVLEAARQIQAPVIIETSLWQLQGHSFGGGDAILGLQSYLALLGNWCQSERFQAVPVVFHTDHIKGAQTMAILQSAMQLGASSVSLDSSEMDEETTIVTLCQLAQFALQNGFDLTLEAEAGVDDGLTDERVTRRILGEVEKHHPGVLALWAPGVGTQHGLSGEMGFSAEHVQFQANLARELCGRDIGIALHGSSGLSEQNLRDAVGAGVTKVNWSSESLLLRSQAAGEFFDRSHEVLNGPKNATWKATAMDNGLQHFVSSHYVPRVVERMEILGAAGKARDFSNHASR